MTETVIYFNLQVDCEALQQSINNAGLGERAIRGLGEILAATKTKATFAIIPADIRCHASIYQELAAQGHELALHVHPADQGYDEFLGVYGFDDQVKIVREAQEVFSEHFGRLPVCFTPGYASANDHTYPVLERLGFRHGLVSIPTRNLPECACVWGNSPQDLHYPHRNNRCLQGDVDFVSVPLTIDPDSRMWGGKHPLDLRVELVDAKNHWYTIQKSVRRQLAAGQSAPVKYLLACTHNVFEYSDPHNFRRETLLGIIAAARSICEQEGAKLVPATTAEIAGHYRRQVPRPQTGVTLKLDTRGRTPQTSKADV